MYPILHFNDKPELVSAIGATWTQLPAEAPSRAATTGLARWKNMDYTDMELPNGYQ
jgi:hypothetical protein